MLNMFQDPHARGEALGLEAVRPSAPLGAALPGRCTQVRRALGLHCLVQQHLQRPLQVRQPVHGQCRHHLFPNPRQLGILDSPSHGVLLFLSLTSIEGRNTKNLTPARLATVASVSAARYASPRSAPIHRYIEIEITERMLHSPDQTPMPDSPKVSVVVPCYNAARYISATLRSVLAQQGFELDVIVVDDGSTDESADIVASTFPTVRLLRQSNKGAAAARNAGIAAATHDWIAFADADDIWLPNKLRAQWELLATAPDARMVYSDLQLWFSAEPEPSPAFLAELARLAADPARWPGPSGWIYPHLLLRSEVATPTVLMHRSVFEEIGTFDPDLRLGQDYDLWLRASRVTPILRVNAPTVLYRIHSANSTRRAPDRNYRALVIMRALERWGYRSPDGACASPSGVRRHLARSWLDYAGAHMNAGSLAEALRGGVRALRTDPAHFAAWKFLAKAALRSLSGRRSMGA